MTVPHTILYTCVPSEYASIFQESFPLQAQDFLVRKDTVGYTVQFVYYIADWHVHVEQVVFLSRFSSQVDNVRAWNSWVDPIALRRQVV